MQNTELLKRILIGKSNPELVRELSVSDIVELVIAALLHVKSIDEKTKELVADKDYPTVKTMGGVLRDLFTNWTARMEEKIQGRLSKLKDGDPGKKGDKGDPGKDAKITKQQIEEAAKMALKLLELPDFRALITAEPESIRNALELLKGKDRLSQSAIDGLEDTLRLLGEQVQRVGSRAPVGGAIFRMRALLDVDMDAIEDGQALVWNAAASKFEPGNVSGASATIETYTVPIGMLTQNGSNVEMDLTQLPHDYIAIRKVFRNGALQDEAKWSILADVLTLTGAVTTNSFQLEYVR